MKYLTLKQAASEAACSTKTLRRDIHSGALEGFMCAGKWLIKSDALHDWIQRKPVRKASRRTSGECLSRTGEDGRGRSERTFDRVMSLRTAA